MRLLPIHWGKPPVGVDWNVLKSAKPADFTDIVKPVTALQGSPGIVLAIWEAPTEFFCDYVLVETLEHDALSAAMAVCLGLEREGVTVSDNRGSVLSDWFQGPVTYVGEEEYHGPAD